MITGYFAFEIRRLNRNLARLGVVLLVLALLWAVALERPYWRRLVGAGSAQAVAARVWPVPFIPAVLVAGGVFCLARGFRRSLNLWAHPLAQSLARSSADIGFDAVAAKLDEGCTIAAPICFGLPFGLGNWSTTGRYRHHSVIRIGPGWLYYGCTLQGHLRKLDDLVWFYRIDHTMRTHRVEVGTAHQLLLRFRDGGELLLSLGETESNLSRQIGKLVQHLPNAVPFAGMNPERRTDVLYALEYFAPWAIIGPDEAMERAWRNPQTRSSVLETVERRKRDSAGSA
jgi:hypothetical protein